MVAYQNIEEKILKLVETKNPATVSELIKLMSTELNLSEKDSIDLILTLEDKEKIFFHENKRDIPPSLFNYIFSQNAFWYWVIFLLSVTTVIISMDFLIKNNFLIYTRYVLGLIHLMYLPGYSVLKNINFDYNFSKIKTIAISIGVSVSITSFIGLILNYTPWGINLGPILFLNTLTILILSTLAIIREYYYHRRTI